MSVKEKAKFVFKRRYLIVRRREKLTGSERGDLTRMLEYMPALGVLRRFTDRIYWLFGTPKDYHQARCRRAKVVHDPDFQAVPELVKAVDQIDESKFPRIMAYLKNPLSRRVRTNNHVERTNWMFRSLEKVRYKWRRRKTLVRFVVMKLDALRSRWTPPEAQAGTTPQEKPVKRPEPQRDDGLQPRRVA